MYKFNLEEKDVIYLKLIGEDGSDLTLDELTYILETTQESLINYYKTFYGITDEEKLKKLSPKIVSAKNGCIKLSVIAEGVIIELVVMGLVKFGKFVLTKLKNKVITLTSNRQVNRTPKNHYLTDFERKLLNTIGASFFVSFLFTWYVDTNHNNWNSHAISTIKNRVIKITNNKSLWESWLNAVLTMDSNSLSQNTIGLSGEEVKEMATTLLTLI